MKRFALVLMLLSVPAMAQDAAPVETVRVEAASLAGLWKISWTMAVVPKPGEQPWDVTAWCRIEQARKEPALHCFNRVSGDLTLENGKLRIAWSPTLIQSEVIEAEMTSADRFVGTHRLRMAGVTWVRSPGLTGVRQQIDPQAPDGAGEAGQMRLILDELARGPLSRPYEKTAQVDLPGLEMLRRLGPVKSTTYLARTPIWRDGAWVRDFFSLYLVDFQNGNRLCGVRQREDGVLDAFRCV